MTTYSDFLKFTTCRVLVHNGQYTEWTEEKTGAGRAKTGEKSLNKEKRITTKPRGAEARDRNREGGIELLKWCTPGAPRFNDSSLRHNADEKTERVALSDCFPSAKTHTHTQRVDLLRHIYRKSLGRRFRLYSPACNIHFLCHDDARKKWKHINSSPLTCIHTPMSFITQLLTRRMLR